MVSRILLRCLPLLFLTALLAGCGGGGHRYATVQGFVYTPDRAPMANVIVRIQGSSLSTKTDDLGHYILGGITPGTCTVLINASGYQRVSLNVNAIAGSTVTVADSTLQIAIRKWTILVYLDADNNLESFGVQDVNEMEAVEDSDQVTTVVQMDRAVGYDTSNSNWQDTRRFVIQHDEDTLRMTSAENPVETMNEVDMGSVTTLRDFINWGTHAYPAEHYMLVLWDHGTGWRSRSVVSGGTRGFAYDDTSGSNIRVADLGSAFLGTPLIDIVSFDACLMQMLEVEYELRYYTTYITCSEENTPDTGYRYDLWLGPLVQNPAMTPIELGKTMADSMIDYYGMSSYVTHSVVDTGKIDNLVAAVDALGAALQEKPGYAQQNADARINADTYAYTDYKDLYDYARLLSMNISDTTIRNAANAVMAAVQQAVLYKVNATMHADSHGISIWGPTPTVFARDARLYTPLGFAKATHWDEWLASQTK